MLMFGCILPPNHSISPIHKSLPGGCSARSDDPTVLLHLRAKLANVVISLGRIRSLKIFVAINRHLRRSIALRCVWRRYQSPVEAPIGRTASCVTRRVTKFSYTPTSPSDLVEY